jgi:quercetin dioxygenase-like cupin family protein
MQAVQLNDVPMKETWVSGVPQQRTRSTFPLLGGVENTQTSVVYLELEPGFELGSHTDSAEEVLFIIQGKVEVIVGDEKAVVDGPAFAVVPTLAPHNLRNVGNDLAKVAGFFPSRYLVATFDNQWEPDKTHVIDTAVIEQLLAAQF